MFLLSNLFALQTYLLAKKAGYNQCHLSPKLALFTKPLTRLLLTQMAKRFPLIRENH